LRRRRSSSKASEDLVCSYRAANGRPGRPTHSPRCRPRSSRCGVRQ
jgi:hypothetical protein